MRANEKAKLRATGRWGKTCLTGYLHYQYIIKYLKSKMLVHRESDISAEDQK